MQLKMQGLMSMTIPQHLRVTDVSKSRLALPFFAGIGPRCQHAHRAAGLDRKIKRLLKDYRKDRDGLLFEVLVALSYAAAGWDVTFIDEGAAKSPDTSGAWRPGVLVERKCMSYLPMCP
jgi:hypothetical protein